MLIIDAIIKPNRLDAVKQALINAGIVGATAVECKGFGKQLGHGPRYRGPKMDAGFVPKIMLRVAVRAEEKSKALKAIVDAARTGEVGDGKIFVYPLTEVIRIRSGESDGAAL